jgi:hypothetical protein
MASGFHHDSALDGIAYASLKSEAKARESGERKPRDENDWIEHDGSGVCPVEEHVLVDMKYRSGKVDSSGMWAGHMFWKHEGFMSDIVAYRLHK